jgi:small subunit ribosomal protein S4
MGDPKRQRKKYESPKYPWSIDRLDSELKLLGVYGLRNKRELWSHYYILSKYRTLARNLLAEPVEERVKLEKGLLSKLFSLNIVPENATLDTILDLSIEDILERRIQTLVYKTGLAKTPLQARQLITHGHISIRGRKVTSPSYILKAEEEEYLKYTSTSVYAKDKSLIWGETSTSPTPTNS